MSAKASSPKPSKPIKFTASTVSPARREAFAILLAMEAGQGHADDLLRARISALSVQDRNLCTTLVLGVLRWQIRLDGFIKQFLTKPNARIDPEVRIALRLGALQLLFLDRIPAHAAIGESVALAKSAGHTFAAGMVNAVLRKIPKMPKPAQTAPPNLTPEQLAETTAHPAWMVERWIANYGLHAASDICLHGQSQPELSIRLEVDGVEAELSAQGIQLAPGAVLTAARRVVSGDVTATAAFDSGRVRIQEEGSQLIAELAGHGERILDCCAAPGGKTLILAERNRHARIHALEISPERFRSFQERTAASPFATQIEVQLADATQLPAKPIYDLVLADVPCSGTGTLGRNPEIRHRLLPVDLARHHERQCAILRSALRSGSGRVIYSTCSLEPEENGDVVAEVLSESPGWRQVPVSDLLHALAQEGRITPESRETFSATQAADGSLTILPGSLGANVQTDGFFIAALQKTT